mgnify:CR=1 FL=1
MYQINAMQYPYLFTSVAFGYIADGLMVLSLSYCLCFSLFLSLCHLSAGDSWVPAACMPYVKIDMTQWF